jgi:hypothetical protein
MGPTLFNAAFVGGSPQGVLEDVVNVLQASTDWDGPRRYDPPPE